MNAVRPSPDVILVVHDDPETREALFEALQAHGFWPIAVGSKEEALEVLQEGSPALVALGVDVPWGPGREVLEALRGSGDWARVPRFFIGRTAPVAGASWEGAFETPFDAASVGREVKRYLAAGPSLLLH